MEPLVWSVVYLLVFCATTVSGQQSCTSGFVTLDELTRLAPLGSNRVNNCQVCVLRREQRLIPDINFTCNGSITKWIFGARFSSRRRRNRLPELQIWRRDAVSQSLYTMVGNSTPNAESESENRVYEYAPDPPLQFEVGDILGILQPERSRLSIYYNNGSGPVNYVRGSSSADGSFDITGISPENALPLVTVEILVDLTDPENGQVAGIVVGVIVSLLVVFAVIILALFIVRKMRRRRRRKAEFTASGVASGIHNPGKTTEKVKRENTRRQDLCDEMSHDAMLPHVSSAYQEYVGVPQQCAHHARLKLAAKHGNVRAQNQRNDHSSNGTDSRFLLSSYEQPVMTKGALYEWGIYVPSEEERNSVISSENGQSTLGVGERVYAALQEAQYVAAGPDPTFFEEADIYWKPSSKKSELFGQLATRKYREIPRHQIQLTEHLGSGQFGTVNKGIWQSPAGAKEVAVKTLKSQASEMDAVKFLKEAAINGQFKHPNVVKLFGVVTIGEPVMIVLELHVNGDLKHYLIKQKPAPGELVPSTTPGMLLNFCRQVAAGMEYLARKAFVHRDLAARNILVSEDRSCKVGDFGMSRDLEDEGYYVARGGKIPVKWTAPEALHYKKYSTASDVWSFGVLMYEIWSLGCQPFEDHTNAQAVKLINSGYRLPPPPGCSRESYKWMIRCWHPVKDTRPQFSQLSEALNQPDLDLLTWSEEDAGVHPQAMVLGAPLEAGKQLYPELQNIYNVQ